MENLNDLIWTDEGNDDGIQPQGIFGIPIACMAEICMGLLCGPGANDYHCKKDPTPYLAGCS